jgi:ABC-2 type transport system permease protein
VRGPGAALARLRALLGKEFLQLLRDPRMRFFVVVPPLVQLFVFGYAATFDVRTATVAVVDDSHTAASRDLLAAVTATGHYRVHRFDDMAAAAAAMDRIEVRGIIHFPHDLPVSRTVQLVADGTDSNSAQIVLGQVGEALEREGARLAGRQPALQLEERAWYNPNLDDQSFFVPGIIGTILLVSTMSLTAMTVVREREMGTLERLMVTPLGRLEFLAGKMIPVACIGLFDVVLVMAIAVLWFQVPFRGSPLALLAGAALYLMSTQGLGLLISSYTSTQQQAMLLAFFVLMPAIILSGFAFPIGNMPEGVQLLTWIDPLRYFLVVVRDLFLKGGGIADHLFGFGMMALLGSGFLALSVSRVR